MKDKVYSSSYPLDKGELLTLSLCSTCQYYFLLVFPRHKCN